MNDALSLYYTLPRRARRYGRRWLAYSDLLGGQPDPRENTAMRDLLAPFRAAIGTAGRHDLDRLTALMDT